MPPADVSLSRLLLVAAAALLLSYGMGFIVWRILRAWRVIDRPNERSSHSEATARGGGLGIMVLWLLGAVVVASQLSSRLAWLLSGTATILAVLSFVDDRKPLPWWVRLGVQTGVAVIGSVGLAGEMSIWWLCLVAILLVGYANAFNFMDGINGLATGQVVLSAIGTVMVALAAGIPSNHPAIWLSILLAGCAAGFFPHNFPRPKMFMGDVGSVPIGFISMFLSAWLARDGRAGLWMSLGALHAGFVLDTSITMIRRALRKERIHEAHREHFYQRLVRAGWPHSGVTGLYLGLAAALQVMLVLATLRQALPVALLATILVWVAYFCFCEWEFSRRKH
jgi:UDP-N-acetylmuramyl pentapeptide phosphotransferase/UDP-N-acetylglucosamine-1-phosphate transferase